MKFFRRLWALREDHAVAIRNSKAQLEEVDRTNPAVDHEQAIAIAQLQEAEAQASRLSASDTRNHYSESLTHAFRGRTA